MKGKKCKTNVQKTLFLTSDLGFQNKKASHGKGKSDHEGELAHYPLSEAS